MPSHAQLVCTICVLATMSQPSLGLSPRGAGQVTNDDDYNDG